MDTKTEMTMRKFSSERGMSLVEATIILMVLAVLTSVIAPSIADYTQDARQTKAKEDVEAIGTAIKRLIRDTGVGCITDTPGTTQCNLVNRVDVLFSNGNEPTVSTAAYNSTGANVLITNDPINWFGATANEVTGTQSDAMDDQLVTNAPGYASVSFTLGGGPKLGVGWRGAYLAGPLGPDPWGYMYQANTVFLLPASDATAGNGNGEASGGWINDVVVLSPGANGDIETIFANDTTGGSAPGGDDVVFIMSGASR
jgi:type II secretory pathway pseudopilin PulG